MVCKVHYVALVRIGFDSRAQAANSFQGRFAMRWMMMGVLALMPFFVGLGQVGAGTIYSLATDWSDTNNPNGQWSYNYDIGAPITVHQTSWDSIDYAAAQPAWAFGAIAVGNGGSPGIVPACFLSNGTALHGWDEPARRVILHSDDQYNGYNGGNTPTNVTWTTPVAGTITISGDTWAAAKALGRTDNWRIRLNDTVLQSGTVSATDSFTSSAPLFFTPVTRPVNVGDVVTFEVARASTYGQPIGVDLTISYFPVPEPSTLALLLASAIGLLVFVARRRR
jgi:hypothetical protein